MSFSLTDTTVRVLEYSMFANSREKDCTRVDLYKTHKCVTL